MTYNYTFIYCFPKVKSSRLNYFQVTSLCARDVFFFHACCEPMVCLLEVGSFYVPKQGNVLFYSKSHIYKAQG